MPSKKSSGSGESPISPLGRENVKKAAPKKKSAVAKKGSEPKQKGQVAKDSFAESIAKFVVKPSWIKLETLRTVNLTFNTNLEISDAEKKTRLEKISTCVVKALAAVAKKDPKLIGPDTSIAGDLGINSSGEQSAAASEIGSCLGIKVTGPFIAACTDVKMLIAALYKAIYKENP